MDTSFPDHQVSTLPDLHYQQILTIMDISTGEHSEAWH